MGGAEFRQNIVVQMICVFLFLLSVEHNPVPVNPVNPDEIFEDDFEDDQIEQNVAVAAPVILEP